MRDKVIFLAGPAANAAATSAAAALASEIAAALSETAAAASAVDAANALAVTYLGGIAGASVPATATTAGDYYRITADGTAQGIDWLVGELAVYEGTSGNWTQILATQASLIAADATIGVSGPQLSSSIVARAPGQGLVFDGRLAEATFTIPAFGESPYSVQLKARQSSAAVARLFWAAGNGAFVVYVSADGAINWGISGSASVATSAGLFTAGKDNDVVFARTSTGASDFRIYVNGVLAYTGTDANNYTAASNSFSDGTADAFNGKLIGRVYNRALSAAEVLSLFESGAPAGADYNNAGTTNANGTWANSGVQAFDTFTPTLGTSFIAASAATATAGSTITAVGVGKRVRVAYNVSAYASGTPKLYLAADKDQLLATALSNVVTMTTTAGVNYAELVSTSASADTLVVEGVGASDFTIEAFAVVYSGLLLAPDATQFGSGLAWQDVSGNNADITLPATGVEWALPSSGTISLGTTKATQATIVGSSTGALTLTPAAAQNMTVSLATNAFLNVTGDIGTSIRATSTGVDSAAFMSVINDAQQWTMRVDGTNADQMDLRDSSAGANKLSIVKGANGGIVLSTGTGLTRAGGTTAATNTVTGGLVIGDGSTAGTNVGIGGGKLYTGSDVTIGGSVTTGAPTTGTAAAWKMGTAVVSGTSTLLTDRYVELDIAGTLYKVALVSNA